jgi:hypothetical protein
MLTNDMKATEINRTILELLALVMISGLMLLAAFSMIVQMDTEMNILEVNAPIAGWSPPTDREDPTSPAHGCQEGGLEGYVGQAAIPLPGIGPFGAMGWKESRENVVDFLDGL